ncbi:hypothetical protein SDRG_12499 [Saprolegnia diclina VS20]|uniref:Uncharacterized protein n=1 Tax=Saprolegnia diclina (strain VS20) TaxID=1156394 RepID=T0RIP0_SAPDV|nr:hypothetical protein SDRG_12499 [Saprolegnia diclina VS20]EQC29727.1 hypothetical protein SDRG_12499 [Saprolegnia diclina VS20]|eukprot:XP_008616793.1 hypothetical protein SDRG_12499 [Saprolegnia diclina VS20]
MPSLHGYRGSCRGEYFDRWPTNWAVRHGHLEILSVSAVAFPMVYLHDVFDQRGSTVDALLPVTR